MASRGSSWYVAVSEERLCLSEGNRPERPQRALGRSHYTEWVRSAKEVWGVAWVSATHRGAGKRVERENGAANDRKRTAAQRLSTTIVSPELFPPSMPIVGDFAGQSSLRGFDEAFFPDTIPSVGSAGGLAGTCPPETSPPRQPHYSPVSLDRKVSGCLLVLSSALLAPNSVVYGWERSRPAASQTQAAGVSRALA
jgi:hypothetical protein